MEMRPSRQEMYPCCIESTPENDISSPVALREPFPVLRMHRILIDEEFHSSLGNQDTSATMRKQRPVDEQVRSGVYGLRMIQRCLVFEHV